MGWYIMAAIGDGWATNAWIEAGWVTGAWFTAVVVAIKNVYIPMFRPRRRR